MAHIIDLTPPCDPILFTLPEQSAETSRGNRWSDKSKIENLNSKIPSPILASVIAIAVWEEASLYLGAKLPRSWIPHLTHRAETICAHNKAFRSRHHAPGNSGRDYSGRSCAIGSQPSSRTMTPASPPGSPTAIWSANR